MKFAALGRTRWLYDSIGAAVARGHEAVLIGTSRAAPEYTVTERDFELLASRLGCPFFASQAINRPDSVRLLEACGAEIGISVNWPGLIGRPVLDLFKHGVINAHPGDLPRFRGNAVPNWAIVTGESRVVLTLHRMATTLDSGPILLQREFSLSSRTYIGEVYRFIQDSIPAMFVEVLDGLQGGDLEARPQPEDPALARRCYPRIPADGEVDWREPADRLAALVRACSEPFAGAYTFLNGRRLTIWRAHAVRPSSPYLGAPGQVAERLAASGEVRVLTQDGVLVLEEVESEAGARGRAYDLITSARVRLGLDHAGEIEKLKRQIADLARRLEGRRDA